MCHIMGILCEQFLSKDPVLHCGKHLEVIWVWGPCVTSWAAFVNDLGRTTLCYTCIMGRFFETQFVLKDPVAQLFIAFFWLVSLG